MVKINDPRGDSAAIAMRSLRATNVFKTIKKIIKKSKHFDEDRLDLQKTDKLFYNDFITCPESVKQELIFLWEEVGDLYEELQTKQESEESEESKETNYNVELVLNKEPAPPPPKRLYVVGP